MATKKARNDAAMQYTDAPMICKRPDSLRASYISWGNASQSKKKGGPLQILNSLPPLQLTRW